jgi:alpha-tubulin suppressor-like RCC1 family protein
MKAKSNLTQLVLFCIIFTQSLSSHAQLTVTHISAGFYHSLFVKSDGSLWAMGDNSDGELGDGTLNSTNRPEEIVSNNVTAVSAGAYFSVFLKSDGSLWAMGYNREGELGDGTANSSYVPEQIVSSNVIAIAAGGHHTLFLKSDGSLWGVGKNQYGELGDGTHNDTYLPEQIIANGVTAIAAGAYYSLFLKSDGSLWAMGWNNYGQLGDGMFSGNSYPIGISNPEEIVSGSVTAIAAGVDHSLFIKSDGSLWAMGDNQSGELGDGTYSTNAPYYGVNLPEQIVSANLMAIAGGGNHSLFIKTDGSLWAMGYNGYGQLGDGTYNNTNLPEQIVSNNVTAISAGYLHSLFLKSDGSLWGMGYNYYGELGDGHFYTYPNQPELIVAGSTLPSGYNHISAQLLTNGVVRLSFVGFPGTNYALDVTFKLSPANWVPLMTNIAGADGTLTFTNTPVSTTNNFWRIRSVP